MEMRVPDNIVLLNMSLIEKQHELILRIINRVVFAEQKGSNEKDIKRIVNDVCKYASETFAVEEAHIRTFRSPECQKHITEHRDFSIMALYFLTKVNNRNYQITDELFEFLHHWLINHIYGTDSKYVCCCKKNLFN